MDGCENNHHKIGDIRELGGPRNNSERGEYLGAGSAGGIMQEAAFQPNFRFHRQQRQEPHVITHVVASPSPNLPTFPLPERNLIYLLILILA